MPEAARLVCLSRAQMGRAAARRKLAWHWRLFSFSVVTVYSPCHLPPLPLPLQARLWGLLLRSLAAGQALFWHR